MPGPQMSPDTSAPARANEHHEHGHIEPFDRIRIAVTAMVAISVWFRVWEPFPQLA